ncbi:MAG: GGDEF domain-containing protein [Gammaproteobacteria bacterium]|nr:GGDEF domain-containing protein [Gammaproteobacteria bacterium]MDH5727502.1 GGDEF domain-containing protein [Gammaproteobacteria bacterium]
MATKISVKVNSKTNSLLIPKDIEEAFQQLSQTQDGTPMMPLHLGGILQTTLDINQLFEFYSRKIMPAIPHRGIHFSSPSLDIDYYLGAKTEFEHSYELIIKDETLGVITLYHEWAFSDRDLKVLTYTLYSLAFPLRNALLYQKAIQAAHKDPLTGIYNRTTFNDTLGREVRLALRYKRGLSLLVLDIDHFKDINDSLGHTQGDCAIKEVASTMANCIRGSDILFRYGGEEFVVILSNTRIAGAQNLAERMRKAIEQNQGVCGQAKVAITASIGVATLEAKENAESLFERADQALMSAKHKGRNRVVVAKQTTTS